MRISILHLMGSLSNHWSIMGIRIGILCQQWHVSHIQTITSTSFKHTMMEMNSLNATMWTIMNIFDDIYFDLNLILLAITMDDISLLLEQEPEPPNFDPLQTIGKYCWLCLPTKPCLPPHLSLPFLTLLIAFCLQTLQIFLFLTISNTSKMMMTIMTW